MDKRYKKSFWRTSKADYTAWTKGETGVPIVDAGMKQLWQTGWMHNRVRMIVSSFLTKNLGINWLQGASWFWDTLVDADLANNSLGWQWVAGCGVDAAPYYRVFNPNTQTKRFDTKFKYINTWLPEHGELDYPQSMVDLASSREQALYRYKHNINS
jgi:deoxyribodipyrimidine photo-lyase